VAHVVNLDNPNVWVQAYEQCVGLFKKVMPMAMRVWPSHNTKIHYNMPPYVKVGINLRFKGFNLEIMFICNRLSWTTNYKGGFLKFPKRSMNNKFRSFKKM
jgi:hypothetical protein